MSKPWFQTELERVTRERWQVKPHVDAYGIENGKAVRCQHGMSVLVMFPQGLDRPFLNTAVERSFVGRILPAHRPWEEVPTPYKELGLI